MTEPAAPRRASFGDLRARVLSAIVLIAFALGALAAGGVWFILFWLAAALAVLWEWQNLVGHGARERFVIGGAGIVVAAALSAQLAPDLALAPLALGAALVAWRAAPGQRAWAAGGVLYAGALIVAVAAIRPALAGAIEPPFNLRAILWLFAVVWGTDVMAYFGGRLIGGPKFWPLVSPSKTWSGTLSGVISGGLLGLAVAKYVSPTPVSWLPVLGLGLVAAMVSQAGDFLESALKRRYGVKDSSNLIPGHGGVMDRLDGFITASAFAALIGAARGLPTVSAGLFHWP